MDQAKSILKKYWGFDEFRDLQEDIILRVSEGKDCIALLPTGGGKSLCYQVPAMMTEGLTLVVSPLVSLMQDQVAQLKEKEISAEYLHSGLPFSEVEKILLAAEKRTIKLLYVSPERLQSKQFKDALPYLNLSLIAVDEAHCISQWGHDFRPEYLQINELREVWKDTPILALTASATKEVLSDIQEQLKIVSATVFRKSFRRDNIFYQVQYSENKHQFVVQYFLKNRNCGIIYCRSRRKTEELALLLQQNNISAIAYHAGMPKEQRSEAQENWMHNKVSVIVATTAFGMGIDKPDVRSVLHFDAPEHLESYYQETGRAGRDGQASTAICLFNFGDIERLENSTRIYYPPEAYLRKIYQAICDFLQIASGTEPDQYFDFDLSRFISNFKLEALPASHALRLLAQEGLWTLSESLFRPASVQFLAERQTIDDINQRYPTLALVTTGLLRLFSGIYHYPTTVHLLSLARHLRMKRDDVEIALRQLHQMGVIDYQQAKEGPQLYFHHYRVPSQELLLNHQRIKRLRDNHQRRTDVMIGFLNNKNQCLNHIMLQYFDEVVPDRCNHCSVCMEQNETIIKPIELKKQILLALQTHGALSLNELLNLAGSDTTQTTILIRSMIEEKQLWLNEEGNVSIYPT
ncbi:MAG: ATP-dependent DNA helicase RecQ [Bacteroidota bacterium]